MNKRSSNWMSLLIASVALSGVSIAFANDPLSCAEGVEAFSRTTHRLLVKNCAHCHGDGGFAVKHSATDPKIAYPIARSFVDFSQLENARIMKKIEAKHWLEYDPSQSGVSPEEMITSLRQWWLEGENSCSAVGFQFVLPPVALTPLLPIFPSDKFETLSWIAEVPGVPGGRCVFTLKIQRFSEISSQAPGTYLVRDPTVRCASLRPVNIRGLRVTVSKAHETFENIYETVQARIDPAAVSPTLLSNEEMILIQRQSQDEIQIALQEFSAD